MSIYILIVAYLVLQIIHTHMFFKQRAVLEIEREIKKGIGTQVLPSWFHTISFGLGVLKVSVLGYMCYIGSWMIAFGLGVGLLALSTILPIPKKYYDDVRKKIADKKLN